MDKEDKRIKEKLLELFPNGITKNLTDVSFYQEINNIRKKKEMKLKEYIEKELGLIYHHKPKKYSIESLVENLLEAYPNKHIDSISRIHKEHQALYLSLMEFCTENNKYNTEYLIELGFEIENFSTINEDSEENNSKVSKSIIDTYTLKEIVENYDCNQSQIAEILGFSRQNFLQRLKTKKLNKPFWHKYEFDEEEVEFIVNAITLREVSVENKAKNMIVKIFFSKENKGDISILLKNKDVFKCKFHFKDIINDKLNEYGYYSFYGQDFMILKEIHNITNGKSEIVNTQITDTKLYPKLKKRAKELGLTLDKYLSSLNIEFIKKNKNFKYDIQTIINILSEYADENNIVYISSEDKIYHTITSLPKRKGYKNYADMLISLGFKYKRAPKRKEDIQKRNINIIKERYIVHDNKIYINSSDRFYNKVYTYCNKNKIKLDDYLEILGYERIKKTKDLPSWYTPYDWKIEEHKKLKELNTEEKVNSLLEDIADDDDNIYLDTNSQTYFYLAKICNIRGITINKLLEDNGYTRIYKYEKYKDEDSNDNTSEDKNENSILWEKEYIQKCLKELENIQTNKENNKITLEKRARNKAIVYKLKQLYHYKCQVCSDNYDEFKTPIIEKDDGTYYVEMHHIQGLSEETNLENEDINLDNYKNGIVVCCYHHKYIHYHLGGFKELVKDKNDTLYLRSKHGELLKVYTNHHLDTNTII